MSGAVLTVAHYASLALALAWSVLTGCGAQARENTQSEQQAIIRGQESGSADDGVMMIWATTSTAIGKCTASLVAPTLVVTALHCVSSFADESFGCTPSGELTPGSTGGQLGATVDPASLSIRAGVGPSLTVVAKGVQIFATQTTTICRNDIAIVLLDRPVSGVPIVPLRLSSGTQLGEQMRLVGYGRDEDGGFGVRRSRPDLVIAQVGSSEFNPMGDAIPPRTLMTVGPAGCIGDSGGPLLSARSALTGVFSQVAGDCEDPSARDFFTELAPFYDDLVAPAFAAAHAQPTLEDTGSAAVAGGMEDQADAAVVPSDAGTVETSEAGASNASGGSSPAYHGPREAGGCTCSLSAPALAGGGAPLALAFPVLLWCWRRRPRRRA